MTVSASVVRKVPVTFCPKGMETGFVSMVKSRFPGIVTLSVHVRYPVFLIVTVYVPSARSMLKVPSGSVVAFFSLLPFLKVISASAIPVSPDFTEPVFVSVASRYSGMSAPENIFTSSIPLSLLLFIFSVGSWLLSNFQFSVSLPQPILFFQKSVVKRSVLETLTP